jgi:hypothetical protein
VLIVFAPWSRRAARGGTRAVAARPSGREPALPRQWPASFGSYRPHQGLRQEPPLRQPGHFVNITARIERGQILGGMIGEYRSAP